MKSTMRMLLLAFGLFSLASVASAQKIAHVNTDSLLADMAERDSVQIKLETKQKFYESEYELLSKDFERAQAEFEQIDKNPQAPPSIKELKRKKMQDLYNNLTQFQQRAQQEMQDYEVELLQPLIDDMKKAIEEVAKEKGYAYVINDQFLLYSPPSDDITQLVKKKLGF